MGSATSLHAEFLEDGHWRLAEPMAPPGEYEDWVDTQLWPKIPVSLVESVSPSVGFSTVLRGGQTPYMAEPIPPSVPSQGLPDDMSSELRAWAEYREVTPAEGGWFTLAEFAAIDWEAPVRMRARVSRKAAKYFGGEYEPFPELPEGVSGSYAKPMNPLVREVIPTIRSLRTWKRHVGTIRGVTHAFSRRSLIHRFQRHWNSRTVQWAFTYRELADPWLIDVVIPPLQELGDPSAVRVVWWQQW